MPIYPNSNEEHSSNSRKEEIFDDEFNDDFSDDKETSLTFMEFSNLTFGTKPLKFDPTDFVCEELDIANFVQLVTPMLETGEQGILRNLFPHLIDLLNRTVTFEKIPTCIQEILKINSNPTLKKLETCKGRDYLVVFLDHIPDQSLPKMLGISVL
ncbi:hypothetical protein G9A89_014250 [Geosiphon pyriformis]|nr:hypothetical protein G9A89_014250 [Geosiphon pyriformis]